ncbi:MAG TPA: rod shape-determining protein [Candidatus Copromorpha excrementigallinarum]|uniref:Cell shape-determining protein MreB n=1 Tax=Candidatus Allocopromorpha excrementigallinarum TaxID=2840742 RepID=A0A9D1HYU1_9FIRM|nr:rod shape-determining protein [Candidatus Copromorpha excrementigallinarum]
MNFSEEVGIDLGTANVLIYVEGKGIVLQEPSVVAVNRDTKEILAIGDEAKRMIGRTPGNIEAVRPLREGVISDYDVTEKMLQYFIRKTCGGSRFFKPRLVVCVPSGVTEVEKRAVKEAAIQAGGRAVYLIEEPVAAAIGAGIDITGPEGVMVIDIGGGTTDIAVISMGGIVTSASVKIAGDNFDQCIIKHIRKEHRLFIGARTAEGLKREAGAARAGEKNLKALCRGRDLVTGLPKTVEISSEEIIKALEEPLDIICEAVHGVLEKTPPELAADVGESGIVITGGGAYLRGLDRRIEERTGIRTRIADEADFCVARGTGESLKYIDVISKNSLNRRETYI